MKDIVTGLREIHSLVITKMKYLVLPKHYFYVIYHSNPNLTFSKTGIFHSAW